MVFEVLVDIKHLAYLEHLKSFFGVGKIYTTEKNRTYRVRRIKDLLTLIPHFSKYPLQTSKVITYQFWVKTLELVGAKEHLSSETFNYIVSIYMALGRKASARVARAFPGVDPIVLPKYTPRVARDTLNPWWLCGYLTLYCTFRLSIRGGGWGESVYNKFRHRFSFSMSLANLELGKMIRKYLEVAYYVRRQDKRVDIQSQTLEQRLRLVRFFSSYPLQSYKHSHFKVWRKYVLSLEHDKRVNRQRQALPRDRSDLYYSLMYKLQRMQNQ